MVVKWAWQGMKGRGYKVKGVWPELRGLGRAEGAWPGPRGVARAEGAWKRLKGRVKV